MSTETHLWPFSDSFQWVHHWRPVIVVGHCSPQPLFFFFCLLCSLICLPGGIWAIKRRAGYSSSGWLKWLWALWLIFQSTGLCVPFSIFYSLYSGYLISVCFCPFAFASAPCHFGISRLHQSDYIDNPFTWCTFSPTTNVSEKFSSSLKMILVCFLLVSVCLCINRFVSKSIWLSRRFAEIDSSAASVFLWLALFFAVCAMASCYWQSTVMSCVEWVSFESIDKHRHAAKLTGEDISYRGYCCPCHCYLCSRTRHPRGHMLPPSLAMFSVISVLEPFAHGGKGHTWLYWRWLNRLVCLSMFTRRNL